MYTFDMPKDEAKSINSKKLLFCEGLTYQQLI